MTSRDARPEAKKPATKKTKLGRKKQDLSHYLDSAGLTDLHLIMAKVIEFYIPTRFQKRVAWVPPEERGKVIEFCAQVKKSA